MEAIFVALSPFVGAGADEPGAANGGGGGSERGRLRGEAWKRRDRVGEGVPLLREVLREDGDCFGLFLCGFSSLPLRLCSLLGLQV